MKKLTGVIIAKDEEGRIGECIDTLSFCDEVLVIDSNSSDKTASIARDKNATVFVYTSSDFSDARNYALSKVKTEWVLYIDADERVSKELEKDIKNVLSNQQSAFSAYKIKRQNYYLGNHPWPEIERLERLFQTKKLTKWQGRLHESPVVEGTVGELDGYLLHYTHRNLTQMLKKTLVWSNIEAQLRFEQHHPPVVWWRFPRVMITAFWESYITQGGWKVGTPGLIESIYQAFSMFITYARLWELQQKHGSMMKNKKS